MVHEPCVLWKQRGTGFSSVGQSEGLQGRLLCWDGDEGCFLPGRGVILWIAARCKTLWGQVLTPTTLPMPHTPIGSANPSMVRNELSSSWWRPKTPSPATPPDLLCPRIYSFHIHLFVSHNNLRKEEAQRLLFPLYGCKDWVSEMQNDSPELHSSWAPWS